MTVQDDFIAAHKVEADRLYNDLNLLTSPEDPGTIKNMIRQMVNYGDSSCQPYIDKVNAILDKMEGQQPIYPEKENLNAQSLPVAPE